MLTASDKTRLEQIDDDIENERTTEYTQADMIWMRCLLNAALRELEAGEWQSIDTIPDDVRYDDVVLLFKPDERRSGASRFIGYWDDQASGWTPVYGSYVVENVTHWMPLPEAPPGTSDGGGDDQR